MKDLKFRVWDYVDYMSAPFNMQDLQDKKIQFTSDCVVMQFVGFQDKNGVDIFEGDILEFADKWEWYRTSYGIKMRFAEPKRKAELQKQYDAEPMERRVIEMPGCYEWILSSEVQTYWHVIGNIYENPELVSSSEIPTREVSETMKTREKEINEMVDRIFEAEKADKKFVADLIEENEHLRQLIEKAFVAGRGKTSWEQFKKDHNY